MYAEASDQLSGSTARLLTGVLSGVVSKCLMFAYHMYGEQMGSLSVFMILYNQGFEQTPRLLWTRSGINFYTKASLNIFQLGLTL